MYVWQVGWGEVGFVGSCAQANLKGFWDIGLSRVVWYLTLGRLGLMGAWEGW